MDKILPMVLFDKNSIVSLSHILCGIAQRSSYPPAQYSYSVGPFLSPLTI